MANLPPYRPRCRCPKCQHGDATTVYVRAGEASWLLQPGVSELPERLVRTCQRCGYQWDQAVARRTRTRRKS